MIQNSLNLTATLLLLALASVSHAHYVKITLGKAGQDLITNLNGMFETAVKAGESIRSNDSVGGADGKEPLQVIEEFEAFVHETVKKIDYTGHLEKIRGGLDEFKGAMMEHDKAAESILTKYAHLCSVDMQEADYAKGQVSVDNVEKQKNEKSQKKLFDSWINDLQDFINVWWFDKSKDKVKEVLDIVNRKSTQIKVVRKLLKHINSATADKDIVELIKGIQNNNDKDSAAAKKWTHVADLLAQLISQLDEFEKNDKKYASQESSFDQQISELDRHSREEFKKIVSESAELGKIINMANKFQEKGLENDSNRSEEVEDMLFTLYSLFNNIHKDVILTIGKPSSSDFEHIAANISNAINRFRFRELPDDIKKLKIIIPEIDVEFSDDKEKVPNMTFQDVKCRVGSKYVSDYTLKTEDLASVVSTLSFLDIDITENLKYFYPRKPINLKTEKIVVSSFNIDDEAKMLDNYEFPSNNFTKGPCELFFLGGEDVQIRFSIGEDRIII